MFWTWQTIEMIAKVGPVSRFRSRLWPYLAQTQLIWTLLDDTEHRMLFIGRYSRNMYLTDFLQKE